MQSYNSTPGRSPMKAGAINSKISAPAGKAPATPSEPPVKAGKGAVKGFAGGVIDPKVKC